MIKSKVQIRQNGIQWTTLQKYQGLIDSLNDTLASQDGYQVVKSSDIRRVITASLPFEGEQIHVFIKHHRHIALKQRLKDLFQISKARNEWVRALEIAQCGVPTVEPIAYGERRKRGVLKESFFISKRIENVETLHQFLLRESKKEQQASFIHWKRKFIKHLAQLLAKIHSQGIDHRDLHAGNILIEKGATDRFYLLDLDRAMIYSKLSPKKQLRCLSNFNMVFSLYVSRADRLRFLKTYFKIAPLGKGDYKKWAARVEEKTHFLCNQLYRSRDKDCLHSNKDFIQFKRKGFKGGYRRDLPSFEVAKFVQDSEKVFKLSEQEGLKRSKKKNLKQIQIEDGNKKINLVLKEYLSKSLFDQFKNFIRHSKGRRSWFAANALLQRQIPTAIPVGYVEKRGFVWAEKSCFIYQFLPQTHVLTLFFQEQFQPPLSLVDKKRKANLLEQCAHFVRYLHERGVYHADLKASNILVRETKEGGFAFYLIDLDYLSTCYHVIAYRRYRNLMQLNKSLLDLKVLSTPDRLAFLKAYLRHEARYKKKLHQVWRVVWYLTKRRLAKTSRVFKK